MGNLYLKNYFPLIKQLNSKKYTTLVLPGGGIGTGLSRLEEKAPKTYNYLQSQIEILKKI